MWSLSQAAFFCHLEASVEKVSCLSCLNAADVMDKGIFAGCLSLDVQRMLNQTFCLLPAAVTSHKEYVHQQQQ